MREQALALCRMAAYMPALLISCASFAQSIDYARLYEKEYRVALTFLESHRDNFEAAAGRAGVGADFMFAIVAPEISQYVNIVDKAQTMALKTLYVQFGKEYADFSIGYFQMKPSFIEQLEEFIHDSDTLSEAFHEIPISGMPPRETRIERIRRMEDNKWQYAYLAAFCSVVRNRFNDIVFPSEEEKLRFYSNAYNAGFLHDAEFLLRPHKAGFPRTGRYRFRYADVALCFFLAVH